MSGSATQLTSVQADTALSTAQNIGFTFVYEGVNYTQFRMSSNGFISLNTTGTSSLTTNDFTTANATSRPIIAPLWDDLDGAATGGSFAGYELTGSVGSRVLTVEWRNWEWNWNSGSPVLSFQIKLYETTNVIEFIYRSESGSVNNGSASIGIGSATGSGANSYLNLTSVATPAVSSTTSQTLLSTKPATGTVYRFTPPPPCSGPPSAGTVSPAVSTICVGSTQAFTVTGNTTGVTGLAYQWETSPDGSTGWANVSGGTGATTASYTTPAYASGTQYYRLRVTCTPTSDIAYSNVVSVSGPANPTIQASAITQTAATTTSATFSWTAGNGNNRSVYINTTNSFVDPTNGVVPGTANTVYGGSGQQLVFNGTGTSVTVTGLTIGTTYFVRVYESRLCTSPSYFYNTATATANPASISTADRLKYNITRTDNIVYTPVSASAVIATPTTGTADDSNYGPFTFFPFQYAGTTVSSFRVTTNGFMTLNSGNTATSFNNGISNSTSNNFVLAPFWEDLYVNNGTPNTQFVKYEVTGTSPNRVLTVQWENVEVFNYPGPSLNFQVKLYESDSHIEYVYGVMQGFDGTNPNNGTVTNGYAFSYTMGMTASTWGTPAVAGEVIALQQANSLSFSSLGGITTNEGVNKLSVMPNCSSMYTFTPAGSIRANDPYPGVPGPPTNDEPAGAIDLTTLPTVPANFCGSFYSSAFATASSGIAAPVSGTTADDDVWFKFTANSTNTTVTVRGSGGYDAVVQIFNDGDYTTPLASKNANGLTGTSLTETINQVDFTTTPGNVYRVRVYHAGGGTQATATATVSGGAITGFTVTNGGTGYITCNGGAGLTATPFVYITDATGSGAVAKVTVTSGAITAIALQGSQGGSGYSGTPTVTVAPSSFGVTGDFSIIVNATPTPPANDDICTATSLTPTATCTTTAGNTFTATASSQAACGGNPDDDVWYSFVSSGTNIITVTGSAVGFNPHVEVFTSSNNTCSGTLTSVACVNATTGGGIETYSGPFTAGQTYFVRVYHSGTGAGTGAFTICVTAPVPACTTNTDPVDAVTQVALLPTLTWAAATNATSYDVYFGTSSGGETLLTNVATTSYTFTTPLLSNTQYFWYIVPKNGNGAPTCGVANETSFTTVSCDVVSNITVSNITAASVDLTWSASLSAPADGYEYEIRTSGAGGSGSTGLVASGSVGAGVLTTTVSGLPSVAGLTAYVRSACSISSSSYSPWRNSAVFSTTYCSPAPTSTDGNGITNVSFSTINNPTGAEPGGYGNYSSLVGDVITGATIPVNITYSTGFTYDTKIWIDWNNDLDFADAGEEVYSGTSLATNPTTLAASFTVPTGVGFYGTHRMRIGGVDAGPPTVCWTSSFGTFEDYTVNVIPVPSCLAPSSPTVNAITNSSATLNWTASASAPSGGYDYYLDTTSTAPTAVTTPTGSVGAGVLTTSLGTLAASTTYYAWVRANCGGGDYSSWAPASAFTTLCDPVSTFPWTETFETTSTTLPCFTVIDGGDSGTWGITTSNPRSGSRAAALNTDFNAANDDYLITPQLTLVGAPKRLRFWVRANSTGEPDEISVRISTTGGSYSDFTNIAMASTPVASTTYQLMTVDLSAYAGSSIYIAFVRNAAPADGWVLYLDDVLVEDLPVCNEPSALTTSSVSTGGAVITWTAPSIAPSNGYEYYVSTSNVTPLTTDTPTGTATGTSATLSTLSANTQYYFWVRSNCGSGTVSDWSSIGSFFTGYCVPAPTSVDGSGITNVTFGTVNNSTGAETGNYADYSGLSATVTQGDVVPVSITYSTGFTYDTRIFIDWNDDLDFDDTGEIAYTGTSLATNPTTLSASFTVPVLATVGPHRMRIGGQDSGPVTPCYSGSFGSFEDYTVNVIAAPICNGTPTGGTVQATFNVCATNTVQLAATGYSTGTGTSFQWEESDDNGVSDAWAAVTGGTGATTPTYTTPALTVTKYYRLRVDCSATALTGYSNVSNVIVSICTYDTAITSASYTSIMPAAGGTGTAFPGWQSTTSGDDNTSTTVSLTGTTFTYQGAPVSGFQASSNGWMTFNTANTSTAFSNDLTSTGQNRVLAPFWDDLVFTGQAYANRDACMRYQVTGVLGSGSAVITVEWAGMERFNIPGPNLNFQVKLYESDNHIEFIYGNFNGFDGTVTSAYSYSVGYNGTTPNGTTASDRFAQQVANTNFFSTTNQTALTRMPACYTMVSLTPGIYSGLTSAPTTPVPSNNEVAGATPLTVLSSPPSELCGTYYTSDGATNSGVGTASCSTAGFEDDDVWFSFNTTTFADYNIRLRSSPGYDGVLQLFDSSMTPITCANSTSAGLVEAINPTGLTTGGATYYLRVFHNGVGSGNGQFSISVNEVVNPPANDNIAGAVTLTVDSVCNPTSSPQPNILVATLSPQTSCTGTPDDDVWYSFVASSTYQVVTVQSGSGYNAVLQVFSSSDNTATGTLTSLTCTNGTSTGGLETYTSNAFVSGNTYFVRIYHAASGAGSGNFTVCVTAPVPVCVAAPTAPAGGANLCASVSGTTLSWAAVTNATAYDVYLDTVDGTTLVSNDQTTTSFTTAAPLAAGTYFWRVVPLNANGEASSCSTFNFTVNPTSVGGSVSSNQTICTGGTPTDVSLSGHVGNVVKWQRASNAAFTSATDIVTTSTTLTSAQMGALTADTWFRAVVQSGACSTANSTAVKITVSPVSVGGSLARSGAVCGTDGGTLTLTGNTGSVVRWESAVSPFTTWSPIANTTSTLSIGMIASTTRYRAVVQSGACSEATSSEITVTVATTWDGTQWSNGAPTTGVAAVFSGNYTADADLIACSLSLINEAVVRVGTVDAGNATTSAYDFDISGPVTVQTGSSLIIEQGSNLLQTGYTGANSGNITVKTKVRVWRQDYVYWGSPVSGQKLFNFSPLTLWNRFYTFSATGNAYVPVFSSSTDPAMATYDFSPGTGYMVRAPNTFANPNYSQPATQPWFNGQFIGVANNGTYNVTTTNGVSNVHMISNPYPSTIDAAAFRSANGGGALYFWTHTNQTAGSNNYASITNSGAAAAYSGGVVPNGTIQVGQGFLLSNTGNVSSVTFNNSMRLGNNAGQFFRTADSDRSRIWLNVANGDVKGNQMLVAYIPSATLADDNGYEAKLIPNGNNISSLIGSDRYVIQARPAFSADDIVPMGLRAETAGTFTVSLDHVDGVFEGDQDIFLKDNLTGVVTNLKQASYSFATEAGDFNDRLQLQYVNTTLGIPGFDANTVVIYKDDNQVLTINAGTIEMANVKIFDIRGRQVYTKEAISSNVAQLGDLKAEHQVLLVQITSADGRVVTKKVAY
ncbi:MULTISPECIES: GEVED domain-containing protein [unclassified Flavobacterium]|uniref:GEVED domain-containing protein n=1 Tax=unclassified Flavobacterium TaxID=196869 RepID=UPI001F13F8EA|nr:MULTISPECIES: GEVED domain-containing protein [unclassified Flavobacterium]UMY65730.1 choice-of-anchor J domain-containing protein [Flavobacterium sp. HJ-32-4]